MGERFGVDCWFIILEQRRRVSFYNYLIWRFGVTVICVIKVGTHKLGRIWITQWLWMGCCGGMDYRDNYLGCVQKKYKLIYVLGMTDCLFPISYLTSLRCWN